MAITTYSQGLSLEHLIPTEGVDFDFSFAFQPIVNARTRQVISFEALVRGPHGEPSADVFAQLRNGSRNRFGQICHLRAIYVASQLNVRTQLNINLFSNASHLTRASIRATVRTALHCSFPIENIVFEVSEAGRMTDYAHLANIFKSHQEFGFQTAIDDFGTGYSGLKLLVEYQPSYIKLDRNLIADIHEDRVKQAIFRGVSQVCKELSIDMMAEGVEKAEEYRWLHTAGVNIFQGYYFARPAFEALVEVPPQLFAL
jgi:EAL domain-containing protein (putative c-di-GMP-specific phosphodiesterase class I)